MKGRTLLLWVLVPVQIACTAFFIWDIAAALLGLRDRPISWQLKEMIEIGAAFGLVTGSLIGARALILTMRRNRRMEEQIKAASAAFADLLQERFKEWGLTPAEQDVAWFTLKGFSIAEIAAFRQTSEGTVKAQSFSIYRKAGVSGRTQLLSLFIEDMLSDPDRQAPAAKAG